MGKNRVGRQQKRWMDETVSSWEHRTGTGRNEQKMGDEAYRSFLPGAAAAAAHSYDRCDQF